jgi:hypothetical protein
MSTAQDLALTIAGIRTFANTVLSVSGAVLVTAAVCILVAGFVRAWRDGRRTKVAVTTLDDAACDPATAGAALGITQRLGEELLVTLPQLATKWTEIVEKSRTDPSWGPIGTVITGGNAALAVQLIGDINASQRQLTESIESLAPDAARNALHIVTQALLRPRGVRVSGVLQRTSNAAGGVGISFTVSDLQGRDTPRQITIWEDKTSAVTGHDVLERIHALVVPCARALACELLRQQLMTQTAARRIRRRLARVSGRMGIAPDHPAGRSYSHEAVIAFVTGLVYHGAARMCSPATMSFYRLSGLALEQADKELDYYKASYLRALSLAELGKREQEQDAQRGATTLLDANRLLETAREKLPRADLPPALMRAEDMKIRSVIATNWCVMVTRRPEEAERAAKAVAVITELQAVDPCGVDDPSALYNMACALATASQATALARHGLVPDRCLTDAKRSLLHACLRDEVWWHDATLDVDLGALYDWMPRAQILLPEERAARGPTTPLEPEAARAVVDAVLDQTAQGPGAEPSPRRRGRTSLSPPVRTDGAAATPRRRGLAVLHPTLRRVPIRRSRA